MLYKLLNLCQVNTKILCLKDKTVNQNIPGIKTFPGEKKQTEIGRKRS